MTGLPGSIGDTVFNDTNGNGVQDYTDSNNNGVKEPNEEGEPGIPGVQLTLRNSEGRNFGTTTTNQNGNYIFDNLPLGTYTVESARPTDFSATTETTLSANLTEANPNTNEVDFGFRPGRLGASSEGPLNLGLVKRITQINNQTFSEFEDNPAREADNDLNSQSPVRGIFQRTEGVQSGDVIEYTIYFLKEGQGELQNVRVCDLVPNGTTLTNDRIIVTGQGNGATNPRTLSPQEPIPEDFANICRTNDENLENGTPAKGAVLVNLGTLPDGIQTGSIRFRVTVD